MLEELAEKFFINKFYLSKIFKETYGTTPGTAGLFGAYDSYALF